MEERYSKLQLEDKAMKSAAMYFGQELLPYLNVRKKIVRLLPTEQIRLEAVRTTEDTLFEMEDGTLAHFEFESVEVKEDDLRRFRYYDSYSGMVYKKTVVTYVVCSGKAERIRDELREGISRYRIIPLQMKQEDADILLFHLQEKTAKGEKLTKEDLAPLLLTPLMSGKSTIKDRILKTGVLLSGENTRLDKEDKRRMEGVLYAFACKFLEKADLEEIKEALGMTVLGEMIWNDGLEAGIEKGREAGSFMKLIHMICRKMQKGKAAEQIAEELEEELPLVERICKVAKQYAPEYDCEAIYHRLKDEEDSFKR